MVEPALMSKETKMKSIPMKLSLALASLALFGAVATSSASAAFGIHAFDGQVTADAGGAAFTQALGHPYEAKTWIAFNTDGVSEGGKPLPDGNVKDLAVNVPPGLIGNPTVADHCTEGQMESGTCPPEAQVGFMIVDISNGLPRSGAAVYNMVPRDGNVAEFGANVLSNAIVHIVPVVRSNGDYGLRLESNGTSQAVPVTNVQVALWGVPSDSSHDPLRLQGGGTVACFEFIPGLGVLCPEGNASSTLPDKPFLTNPGNCSAGPLTTTARANSWQNPGVEVETSFTSHLPPGYPLEPSEWGASTGVDGCDGVKFEPAFEATPDNAIAGSPTGLSVNLSFDQAGLEEKEGRAASPLRDAKVTFPEGLAINPAAASGLQACSDAQLGLASTKPASCPGGAKIGVASATSPLLNEYDEAGNVVLGPGGVPVLEKLTGGVYVRSQASGDPESGEMFRLALVLENKKRGLQIKLPGKVRANRATGQLVASFENNPQLPVAEVNLDLNSGPRATLVAPSTCGSKTISAELTSWSGQSISLSDSFDVTGCKAARSFSPTLEAGVENPVGGTHSAFNLRLMRGENEKELTALNVSTPPGLAAYLKGVSYCSDAAITAAASQLGAAELAAPSCPSASQIGQVTVGAGAGPLPYYVNTGRVYLAGPYKGAPLSLAIDTPAVAGPFDLGNVLTRAAVNVNPETAELSVFSDPIPTILGGVPLNVRDLRVAIDRPQFMVNPTNCEAMSIGARVSGSEGGSAQLDSRFQVADCASLAFAPKLALNIKGGHKRGAYQKLKAVLTQPKGQAGIGKVSVAMPHSIFLAQEHIQTICTRPRFAAGTCPKGSIYGKARAFTPLLDQPLEGPVYLRANGGERELPDLVADLHGQIDVELVGYIDSVNGGIRTRFQNVPDAPVSKFVLNMKGGKKSLLVNSRNVCKSTSRATVKMDGQNGKVNDFRPLLKNSCGAKGTKQANNNRRGSN